MKNFSIDMVEGLSLLGLLIGAIVLSLPSSKDPEIYTRTKEEMDYRHELNPDGSVTVYNCRMTGWIPKSALERKIIWADSPKKKDWGDYELGFREDGIVVWRKTKK